MILLLIVEEPRKLNEVATVKNFSLCLCLEESLCELGKKTSRYLKKKNPLWLYCYKLKSSKILYDQRFEGYSM